MDETQPLLQGSVSHGHRLYASRWAMLSMLVLLQCSSAMIWLSFSPIVGIFENYYNAKVIMVDLTSILFMAVSIPFGFLGSWCLNTLGLRKSMVIAAWINCAGAAIRYGGDYTWTPHMRLAMVLVGQGVAACAQPIILDSPTLLAGRWFGEDERAMANTIASIANPVGMAIASVMAPAIVKKESDMSTLLLIMAMPAAAAALLTTLFFRSEPPSPPSASAETTSDSFSVGIRKLMKNKAYLLLLFSFSVGIALVSSLTSLLGQITSGQGYSDDQAGYMGLVTVACGLLGAGLAGAYLDHTHKFLETMKACFVCATISLVGFMLACWPGRFEYLMAACGALGFCAFAALPTGMELCVETTYPVNEGLSTGLIWIASQALGIVMMMTTNALAGEERWYDGTQRFIPDPDHPIPTPYPKGIHKYYSYTRAVYMLLAFTALATISILFMHTDYKRMAAEAKSEKQHKEGDIQHSSTA